MNIDNKSFAPIDDEALRKTLTALSRSINILGTYGSEHPAFGHAFDDTFAELKRFFLSQKQVFIGSFGGVMTVNEKPVSVQGGLLKSLEKRLANLEITNLSISANIAEEEFRTLVELLAQKEAQQFKERISSAGLTSITNEDSVYHAVRKGHTVASEDELVGVGGGAASQDGSVGDESADIGGALEDGVLVLDEGPTGSGGNGPVAPIVQVDQIVAFLKGDTDIDTSDIEQDLHELANEPDKLAQMIMESVKIRQVASGLEGESLSDIILGCLRRTYEGLRQTPERQSLDGKASLKKSLLLLEKSILEKLRMLGGDADPEMERQIIQAMRSMEEDVEMEMIAEEYAAHRNAIAESEQTIASYIRERGVGPAQEILSQADFNPKDWRRIIMQSNRETAGPGSPASPDLGTLAVVLEELEQLMQSERVDNKQLKDLVSQASSNMNGIADSTKDKLDDLAKRIASPGREAGTVGGHADGMSRTDLMSSIAEIAQELMQPLTAISASIEMILCGYAGELNPEQRNLATLASGSGEHLRNLMDELINIVGFPVNLGVEERYIQYRNKQTLE